MDMRLVIAVSSTADSSPQEIFVDDCAYFAATHSTQWRVERATRLSHFLDKRTAS